jgi:hypothetical protein
MVRAVVNRLLESKNNFSRAKENLFSNIIHPHDFGKKKFKIHIWIRIINSYVDDDAPPKHLIFYKNF